MDAFGERTPTAEDIESIGALLAGAADYYEATNDTVLDKKNLDRIAAVIEVYTEQFIGKAD